jgi:general stress protein 26
MGTNNSKWRPCAASGTGLVIRRCTSDHKKTGSKEAPMPDTAFSEGNSNKTDHIDTLFYQAEQLRFGMLGIEGSGQHMQPMSHHMDRANQAIWFISSADTDLVKAILPPRTTQFCLVSPDGAFQACISGKLSVSDDEAKLDELWSFASAAWFEDGRRDPKVRLLRLAMEQASVWVSTSSSLTFGIEMLKSAILKDRQPELGDHFMLAFDQQP